MLLATRRSSLHARGIERRQRLLAAARELLSVRELDEISLGDVAARAGVPKGSAYHFYADVGDLYASLLVKLQEELITRLERPIRGRVARWQDVIGVLTRRGMQYYNGNAAARQLQIGPKTPPQLKLSDRRSDVAIGRLFEKHVGNFFLLPQIADRSRIFFRAVEISDLMFCLSVLESGHVTDEMYREADRACVAYLGSYLPARLPLRKERAARRK